MSNLETQPAQVDCIPETEPAPGGPKVELLTSRAVPLGRPRAMTVHRTLPQRQRSFIGGWCFVDHYGPDDVAATGGMDVPPHPHTALATVSWLFTGTIEHRDTMGNHAMVRPGELNLMGAGHGIAHTEVSTPDTTILHGVQLWVAFPAHAADGPREFHHYVPPTVTADGLSARVFLGELLGSVSPVPTHSPLVGAELHIDAGASITLPLRGDFEYGVLVDSGLVEVAGSGIDPLERTQLGYIGLGAESMTLINRADEPARIIFIGGEPLGEELIMWWNFIGRTHEDIVRFRDQWMAYESDPAAFARFGQVQGYEGDVQHLPAPRLPNTRLRTRENRPGRA